MCGRTAQTQRAIVAASTSLNSRFGGRFVDNIGPRVGDDGATIETESEVPEVGGQYPWQDNFNLCPGHDAVVFTMNKKGEIEMSRKVWGLVTKGGTAKTPLPSGLTNHFKSLMFNARSDTLFSKPTFARLLNSGKACLVALDGFFEWKTDPLGGGKGKKQPYFVFRNEDHSKGKSDNNDSTPRKPYLLMAGLWTSVSTGYSPPQPATLDTFTILTTEVCDPLKWLHSRMPVCIWEEDLALQWLQQPAHKLHQQMYQGANKTTDALLQWHAVSTQMSSVKYRSADCIKALPKPTSVKSFFAPVNKTKKCDSSPGKAKKTGDAKIEGGKEKSPKPPPLAGTKRPGPTILSFFSPKKKT